jgi:16S rRNA (guanine527-N7)-methyltransferase
VSLELRELVAIEFKRNGLFYVDKIGEVFELYADLLISENKKYNLTSIINPQDIVDKHFVDSILGFEKFKEKNPKTLPLVIMDIGTGAGFPGIPLILYDQICNKGKLIKEIHLVDSNKKKTEFLCLVGDILAKSLGKKLFTVHNNRLETLELVGDSPDLFLSRATGNINKVIEHLGEFLVKNGQILNASSLLYYGGLNVQRLKEGYELKSKTDYGHRVQFNVSMEIIAEFEFSIHNYRRINIMYSLNPGT